MLSEPPEWTRARRQRMAQQYPQLAVGTANDMLNVDAAGLPKQLPVSDFSKDAMQLAVYAAQHRTR